MDEKNLDQVLKLSRDGSICEVYGHRWENDDCIVVFREGNPAFNCAKRQCGICGKVQVKEEPRWEDYKVMGCKKKKGKGK